MCACDQTAPHQDFRKFPGKTPGKKDMIPPEGFAWLLKDAHVWAYHVKRSLIYETVLSSNVLCKPQSSFSPCSPKCGADVRSCLTPAGRDSQQASHLLHHWCYIYVTGCAITNFRILHLRKVFFSQLTKRCFGGWHQLPRNLLLWSC